MKKPFLLLIAALILSLPSSPAATFRGTVTAVDSNGNAPGYSFTAADADGKIKMFRISNLKHLDLNDRVIVTYPDNTSVFPIAATRVKFLPPQ
jgi:hypothetical protein